MAQTFYTLLTHTGAANLATAQAFGLHVPVAMIAVGDGGGQAVIPTESATALRNECWRQPLNAVSVDSENPNWLVFEAVIPANVGGFMIREIGLIGGLNPQNLNDPVPGSLLLAYSNYPETYKPQIEEGAAKDLVIRMIVEIGNAALVQLTIDPAVVLATKSNIETAIQQHRQEANPHDGRYAPLSHTSAPDAHGDIRAAMAAFQAETALAMLARIPWFGPGAPMPEQNIGPIWHDDFNSLMTWQVFDANGANWSGYASQFVGELRLDTQPTPRKGYVTCGASNLSRVTYAALRAWAMHNGIMVASGAWHAGAVEVADNADGETFRIFELRGEFLRAADGGRGTDAGRGFGSWQGATALANHVQNQLPMLTVGIQNLDAADPNTPWNWPSSAVMTAANFVTQNNPGIRGGFRPRNVALGATVKF